MFFIFIYFFFFFRDCLCHITTAANFFLTISNETMFKDTKVAETFSHLNLAQLKHLADLFSVQQKIPSKLINQIDDTCVASNIGKMPLLCPITVPL